MLTRYYGCGLVLPELLEDLMRARSGCGAGRDVYVLSKLVGENGRVVGVDMTEEQLAVARQHEEYHRKVFGYAASNVRFLARIHRAAVGAQTGRCERGCDCFELRAQPCARQGSGAA